MIPRQVEDFLIGTTDESIAKTITKRTGKRVKFQHKENLPITSTKVQGWASETRICFDVALGLVEDHCGADAKEFNDWNCNPRDASRDTWSPLC